MKLGVKFLHALRLTSFPYSDASVMFSILLCTTLATLQLLDDWYLAEISKKSKENQIISYSMCVLNSLVVISMFNIQQLILKFFCSSYFWCKLLVFVFSENHIFMYFFILFYAFFIKFSNYYLNFIYLMSIM